MRKWRLQDLIFQLINLLQLSVWSEQLNLKIMMNEASSDVTTSFINKCIETWEQKSEWCPRWNKSVLQKQQGKADERDNTRPGSRQSIRFDLIFIYFIKIFI